MSRGPSNVGCGDGMPTESRGGSLDGARADTRTPGHRRLPYQSRLLNVETNITHWLFFGRHQVCRYLPGGDLQTTDVLSSGNELVELVSNRSEMVRHRGNSQNTWPRDDWRTASFEGRHTGPATLGNRHVVGAGEGLWCVPLNRADIRSDYRKSAW